MPIDMNLPPSGPDNHPWRPTFSVVYKKPEKENADLNLLDYFKKNSGGDGDPPNPDDFFPTRDTIPDTYQTLDGNTRYYHNPKAGHTTQDGQEKVDYSLGATKCPFVDLDEMKVKTRVPESLGESDFFVNWVNAGSRSDADTIVTDKNTGNRYYYNPNNFGVDYEGGKHFNIQRFLIDPHYRHFHIKTSEARMNALYDMYRYFLYKEKGNRDVAWEKANKLITEYVDPIVSGKYAKWANDNYKKLGINNLSDSEYYVGDFNLYDSEDNTHLPDIVISYNYKVLSGKIQGNPFSRNEMIDILTDYNITYRKKSPEEAKSIAEVSIKKVEDRYRENEEFVKNRPLQEFKIIREGKYPEGYDKWTADEQFWWLNDEANADLLEQYQEGFTEEDRKAQLEKLKNYRFTDQ